MLAERRTLSAPSLSIADPPVDNSGRARDSPYALLMRWDRFFDDLEGQLASEWEAERAVLDTEAERLRLSKATLRDRLAALAADGAEHGIELIDDTVLSARIEAVGPDWVAVEAGVARPGILIVPLAAIRAITLARDALLRSSRPAAPSRARLIERMTLGFVLRDAARRRVPVSLQLRGGRALAGTIDRAGADHLDLALHDLASPRRTDEVTGYRMVPLASLACVRMDAGALRMP